MADEPKKVSTDTMPRRPLPPAAQRALAEAEARRAEAVKARDNSKENGPENNPNGQKEVNGPKGPEPTRYGDWEIKGIASDF